MGPVMSAENSPLRQPVTARFNALSWLCAFVLSARPQTDGLFNGSFKTVNKDEW